MVGDVRDTVNDQRVVDQGDWQEMSNRSTVGARVWLDEGVGGEVVTRVSFGPADRPNGPLHGCSSFSSVLPHPSVEDAILGEAGDVSGGVAPSSCVVRQRLQL